MFDRTEKADFFIKYEMAITPDDLRRLFPYLQGGQEAKLDNLSVAAEVAPGRGWRLSLANPRSRRIGSMQFPLADLEVRLWGFTPDETDRFLDHLQLVFRRGGG